jgi:hypothetical protein
MTEPDGRPSVLVIQARPVARRRVRWPLAMRPLRCLLGFHPWPREMRIRRGPDGAIQFPPVVCWTCAQCGRPLGETNLSSIGID